MLNIRQNNCDLNRIYMVGMQNKYTCVIAPNDVMDTAADLFDWHK